MKKLVLFILLCGVAYAATFSELERRVFELEQQVAKLTIKLLDKEMAKESPILNVTIDTNNYVTGLPSDSTDESDEDDEYIEVEIPVYIPQEPTIKKTYQSKVNGRSLKAVPTIDTECIDECMMEYPPSRRTDCIETKCGGGND